MYRRADCRVKTPAKLLAQVQACNTNLGKNYFPRKRSTSPRTSTSSSTSSSHDRRQRYPRRCRRRRRCIAGLEHRAFPTPNCASDSPGCRADARGNRIEKTFDFANYYETIAFVNALAPLRIARIITRLAVHYNRCTLRIRRTAGGVTMNDLICAARWRARSSESRGLRRTAYRRRGDECLARGES
jgi:pterin-4a-carbinolamine dehydratase